MRELATIIPLIKCLSSLLFLNNEWEELKCFQVSTEMIRWVFFLILLCHSPINESAISFIYARLVLI